MSLRKSHWLLVCTVCWLGMAPVAHAQMAVVDARAVAQLVQQIRVMRDQLTQARQEFNSISGARGMERLLAGTARNYLPPDWQQLVAALDRTSAGYGALAVELQGLINANAILTPQQIAALSPAERTQLEAGRRSAAMLQALTRVSLSATSQRFSSIQQLIDAIPLAGDQKAILDLQARIQAEQGMLQNEATKLGVLYQTVQAEESARRQRAREHAIASIGSLRNLPPLRL